MKKILLNAPSKLSHFYLRTIFILLACIGMSSVSYSQTPLQTNYNYSESVNPANYVPITGGTVLRSPGAALTNMATVGVAMPFAFYYNNGLVSQVNIYDNGFITFGTSGLPANSITSVISDATSGGTYTGAVACYGYDLRSSLPDVSEIRYEVVGSSPNRVFVIQYKDVRRLGDAGALMNMQIRINESNGTIETVYKENFASAFNTPLTAQVGLRGSTNADFYNRKKSTTTIVNDGSFVVGQQYQINSVGTTNWVAIGASSNTIGVNFVATGPGGAGTGNARVFIWPGVDGTIDGTLATDVLTTQGLGTTIPITSLVAGQQYTIQTVGTGANWTSIGASSAAVGVIFTASGPGTGTGSIALIATAPFVQQGYQAGTKLVWTPCFRPTSIVASLQSDVTQMDISWTAPLFPSSGATYDWEVRTSGAGGSGAVGLFAFGNNITGTSVTVSGLTIGTPYFIYVKRSCKTTWLTSTPASLTPTCAAASIPYTQNFEAVTVPAIPGCNYVINSNVTYPNITTDNTSVAFYGFNNKNFITTNANANNEWYFTQLLNLPAGSYRLSYKYGGTRELSYLEQKMKVMYGTGTAGVAPTAGSMTTLLADHTSIKDSPLTNIVNFTVTTPGTYYIGFNGYAAATNGSLQLDDINVQVSTCLKPTGLNSGQITATTAIISWGTVASANSGYDYYYAPASGATSTSGTFVIGQRYQILTLGTTDFTTIGASANTIGVTFTATGVGGGTGTARIVTAPASSVVPSGTVAAGTIIASLGGLTPSTAYNFWVRSQCGGGDVGEWSIGSGFVTPAIVTYCTPNGGSPFFQDPDGIINVTMGSINNTTAVEPNAYGNYSSLVTNVSQGQTVPVSITFNTGFTYDTIIWVDWNNDGDFADSDETVYTGMSTNAEPTTLSASFTVPTLNSLGIDTQGAHRLRIGSNDSPLFAGGALTDCRNGSYQAFEDYTIFVVVAPPAISLSATSATICEGATTPSPGSLTVTVAGGSGSYQVYNWTPNSGVTGTIGAGYNFTPTATTTYTLTATQTSGNYSSTTATYTVNVNPLPTPIAVTPATATSCSVETLVATGGIVSGVTVFNERFNGGTNTFTDIFDSTGTLTGVSTFTTVNNSAGTSPSSSAWTLSTNPNTTGQTFTSNDSSQFYLSDSDQQGSGGLTNTELISPVFSLTGFTDAALSFWHYYRDLGGNAEVQISTDGGGTYNVLTGGNFNSTQGGPTSFVNVVINLTAYAGTSNLRIKFKYINAPFAWWWAIDNVKVSGSSATSIVWSPSGAGSGLFTDAGATTVYTGTPTSTVYAFPNANTVYTASAVSAGCTRYSNTATINVSKAIWSSGTWSNGTGPSNTIAAEFQSNFTSSVNASATLGNLSACSVKVTSGTVLFDRGTLTVQGPVTITGGSLTFDDASYDVSLYQPNNVTNGAGVYNGGNSGDITFRRTASPMYKFDYTYWSAPVFAQKLLPFSPDSPANLFLHYNNGWQYITNPATTDMVVCKGYIIRAPANYPVFPAGPNSFQGSFVGVPNNGTLSTPIIGGAGQFNFIGNPYPSSLDANDFINANANISGTLYFWTHNTPINASYQYALNGDYASYNLSGGVAAANPQQGSANNNQPDKYIASGQGFFVKGLTASNAVFQNTMREAVSNNNFYRTSNNVDNELEKHRYWLNISSAQGAFKQALIAYAETATLDLDRLFDGDLVEAGNVISIYTKVADTKLTIQGRPIPFDNSDLVPLCYKSTIASVYTITMPQYDGLFTEQHVYLEDMLLNVIHDLRESPYVFNTEIGTFENRFVLRYTTQALGTNNPVFNQNSVVVYKNEQGLFINSGKVNMKNVTVYDVLGRVLATKKQIQNTTTVFTNLPSATEVLLVKIEGENGGVVTKKIAY